VTSSYVFEGLTPLRYGLIMADPAWSFDNWSAKGEKKNAKAHYRCMPLADIKALPVNHLAAPDCLLWLWATNPMLPQALETMAAWGFTFKTAGVWHKRTVHGKTAFGPGYILRGASEPFLIGTIGKPKTTNSVRTVIEGVVREHSRKPEEAYEAAERLVPDVWRCELFSRQQRPGWTVWGNETEKFSATHL
jgi:N6-adenosine-specific RNA methylase IME4